MINLITAIEKHNTTYLLEKRKDITHRKGRSLLSKLAYYFAL